MLTNCIWFLFQFGNTCYCNSVLQALYFCRPFRDRVLQFKQLQKNNKKESLLTCLADLFYSIASQKKKVGTIAPKKFITRLRKEYGKCQCILLLWEIFILEFEILKVFEIIKNLGFFYRSLWQLHATRCPRVPELSVESCVWTSSG